MKYYLSDYYQVELYYPLDDISIDVLHQLYQPIIGSSPLNLYMTLVSEGKRMGRFIQPCLLSRLLSITNLSLDELAQNLKILEGIGLIKEFVRNKENKTNYVFMLCSPLSIKSFFKNRMLTTLLDEALGDEEFDKTRAYFKLNVEDKSDYEEVTASFSDVFTIDLNKKQGKVLDVSDEYKERNENDIVLDYDFDLFYEELRNYQIPKSLITKQDEQVIAQYASVYSIDVLSMVSIVRESIEKNKLNYETLKKQVEAFHEVNSSSKLTEIYLKQPVQYKMNDNSSSELAQHLRYLENISPYELLKQKQGGKEPVFHDLRIVETLMVQLGLKPAVINVLIEYVLGTNDNRLSARYCEAIGSSWARKNIVNARQAYEEAMKNRENNDFIDTPKEVNNEDNSEEFNSLLNELKEGKL